MKTKIAFYPLTGETLSVAEYISKFSEKYEISAYFTFPGSGLAGMDIGRARNRMNTGIHIAENYSDDKNEWDLLFIADYNRASPNDDLFDIITSAFNKNRKVICAKILDAEDFQRIKSVQRNESDFQYLPYTLIKSPRNKKLHNINATMIFVGGVINQANTIDVFYNMTGYLKQQGKKIASFSTDYNGFFLDPDIFHCFDLNSIQLRDISLYINAIVYEVEIKQHPDIILLHLPDGLFEYNDAVPNGVGILTYIYSMAVQPDVFICCIPYDLCNPDFISGINKELLKRYDFGIDYVHISNVVVDGADIVSDNEISIIMKKNHNKNRLSIEAYACTFTPCSCAGACPGSCPSCIDQYTAADTNTGYATIANGVTMSNYYSNFVS